MLSIFIVIVVLVVGYLLITQRRLVHLDERCDDTLSKINELLNACYKECNTFKKYFQNENRVDIEIKKHLTLNRSSTADIRKNEIERVERLFELFQKIKEDQPELKSDPHYLQSIKKFSSLIDEIHENHILYITLSTKLERKIRRLPSTWIAYLLGFQRRRGRFL